MSLASTLDPAELLKLDATARMAALDPEDSFIIDAPAGAGKTELLTQRFLTLLARVANPEEIIALTFTNKAAAEMRERIMQSLQAATRSLAADSPAHKAITYQLACAVLENNDRRQWQLLQQPSRLRVMTLDALAARITYQMPLLSRFGTQPSIADEPARYYEQAVRNTLEQLEDGGTDSETIAQALTYFDNDSGRLQRMLISMLARRDQWLDHVFGNIANPESLQQDVSAALHELVSSRLASIYSRIPASRQAQFMPAARYAAAQSPDSPIHLLTDWEIPLDAQPEKLPQWRALAELFLTGKNELRKIYQKPINLAGTAHQTQKQVLLDILADFAATGEGETLAAIRELPEPYLATDDAEMINCLAALLRLAYAQLWLVFVREKVVDFSEITARACTALRDDEASGEIREHLDYQLSHLLVDEFQDTSPLQVRLLERLTAGWEDDPLRSVFLVGDPMQSIYRFRKADVGLFLRVRNHGLGKLHPRHLQLFRNNRSYAEIIEWVNQTFPQVFADDDDVIRGAVRYAPSAPGKPAYPTAHVSVHPIIQAGHSADTSEETTRRSADEREATTIITLIRQARQDNPDGTVAILVRARNHLNPLLEQLQNTAPDIPFQAVEINALGNRQAIQDLCSLTRALLHPADRVHWLAILRAPWCGLKLADLHTLAADDHQKTLWSLMQDEKRIAQLSDDGQRRLMPLRQSLAVAYQHRNLQRPRRWIEGVWHALGGPACLQASSDVQDVQAYFQMLDTLELHGSLDLSRLDNALANLYAAPDTSPASGHVQLMTIHKSKGLEFDTVILPGLHRAPRSDDKALLLWDNLLLDDGEEHLVVAPAPPPGAPEKELPTPYDLLRKLESTRAQNEDKRVLYVAVTRAIRCLHLLAVVNRDSRNEAALAPPPANALLAPLWPMLEPTFMAAMQAPQPTDRISEPAINAATFIPKLVRVASPLLLAHPPSAQLPPSTNVPTHSSSSTLDMDIGTLVHRYLEAFASDGLDIWDHERVNTLRPRITQYFGTRGHEPMEVAEATELTISTLHSALSQETGRWVLGAHEQAGCEVPLNRLIESAASPTTDEGSLEIQRNVVDRTFVENGVRWIIDYKTLRLTHSEPDQMIELLKAKAEIYRPQLERYAALFAHETAAGLRIQTAIFFPAYNTLVKL